MTKEEDKWCYERGKWYSEQPNPKKRYTRRPMSRNKVRPKNPEKRA